MTTEQKARDMIKTQYCQNCEATERRFSDFRQEVSDALLAYYGGYHNASGESLERFIIPKPKPDPLSQLLEEKSK